MKHPIHLVVMGVTGSGKTTIAQALAARLDWDYVDGDDLHPAANIAKMAAGTPLTDADRAPWLEAIADWIRAHDTAEHSTVVACSALKRAYRDVLRDAAPDVRHIHLHVPVDALTQRLRERTEHFMPPALLNSQLAALEPLGKDEPGHTITPGTPAETVETALAWLSSVQ